MSFAGMRVELTDRRAYRNLGRAQGDRNPVHRFRLLGLMDDRHPALAEASPRQILRYLQKYCRVVLYLREQGLPEPMNGACHGACPSR